MYRRVSAVDVFLWGRHVGRIAPDFGSYCQFQYDPEFIRARLQISPIMLPLRREIYHSNSFELPRGAFMGLPTSRKDSSIGWSSSPLTGSLMPAAPSSTSISRLARPESE